MLYLNAGFAQIGAFSEISYNEVQSQVAVNAIQPAYTAKVLIDQLLARKQRSAIVVTASVAGIRPIAGSLIYCCTKTFATFLGDGLSHEVKDKIDCLAWQPAYVSTKMVGNKKQSATVLSVTDAVKCMHNQLGFESRSFGNHIHAILAFVIPLIPNMFLQNKALTSTRKQHKKCQEQGRSDK